MCHASWVMNTIDRRRMSGKKLEWATAIISSSTKNFEILNYNIFLKAFCVVYGSGMSSQCLPCSQPTVQHSGFFRKTASFHNNTYLHENVYISILDDMVNKLTESYKSLHRCAAIVHYKHGFIR